MAIPSAPLQLRDYAVTDLAYRRRPDGERTPDDGLTMRFEMEGARAGGETVLLVLRVWFNEAEDDDSETPPAPHTGHVEVRGGFQWVGPEDVPGRDRLTVVNGLSVLYGIARVYVAQASGSGPDARLVLPSVSFHEVDLDLDGAGPAAGETPAEPAKKPTAKRTRKPKAS